MSRTETPPEATVETPPVEPTPPPDHEKVIPSVEPPKQRRRRRTTVSKKPTPAQIGKQLSDGAKALSVGAVMASGRAEILNQPGIVNAIEDRCDKFGASWAAVAEQDPRVAMWLNTIMTGGVWISAFGQTAMLGATIGFVTGRVRVPLAAIQFAMPELLPYLSAPSEPASNGPEPPPEPQGF